MYNQTEILFSVHERENSFSNEQHLNENKIRFSNQCKQVFNLMMSGQTLTSYAAMVNHCIGHLARRIKDLKENGVAVSDSWAYTDAGVKVKHWFFSETDKMMNKKFCN